jgi:hypothetical protein
LLFSFDFHDDTDKLCLDYAVKYPADIIGKTPLKETTGKDWLFL